MLKRSLSLLYQVWQTFILESNCWPLLWKLFFIWWNSQVSCILHKNSCLISFSARIYKSHDMTWHDKTNKMSVCPVKTQISLGIYPVWSVFTVRMKKAWVLPIKRTVKTLIRLGGCPGWSESSLAAVTLLVLSCRGSYRLTQGWRQ